MGWSELIINTFIVFSLVYAHFQPFLKKSKNLKLQPAKCEINFFHHMWYNDPAIRR